MEIEATRLFAAQSRPEVVPPTVEAIQIDAFTNALFGHADKTPETLAVVRLQEKSAEVAQVLSNAPLDTDVINSPLDMLAMQASVLRTIGEVDLISKTAGLVSQGVNKLVNLQ
jgi:type III secretion system YscI/HrpB-like protein